MSSVADRPVLSGPLTALALRGTVVSMAGDPVPEGVVYIRNERILAIRSRREPIPDGFPAGAPTVDTSGVIYPGLFDLHNHLPYNVLPLWSPPQRFDERNDWIKGPGREDYRRHVGEPMKTLNERGGADIRNAIVRYVEVKLMLGGVTSGQGMDPRDAKISRGLVRNFEAETVADLPPALTRVEDLTASEVASFRARLDSGKMMFYHLAEGISGHARRNFDLLEQNALVRPNLIGIHSADLLPDQFQAMANAGARVVWSPLSNSLLYGDTLNPRHLLDAGVRFGLGSDWTPSGSRNLLLELKVAKLFGAARGGPSSAQLVDAVTRQAANVVAWSAQLGTLQPDRLADIVVFERREADPFENLVSATERDVKLVVIGGAPRYGDDALFASLGVPASELEPLVVGGRRKALRLSEAESPLNGLTFASARDALADALHHLHDLRARRHAHLLEEQSGSSVPPLHLDMPDGAPPAPSLFARIGAVLGLEKTSLPPLASIDLDPATVIDDPGSLFDQIDRIRHVPELLKGSAGLRRFYR